MIGSGEQTDETPNIRASLSGRANLSARDVVDLVVCDQEQRWQRGERVFLETYFAMHPSLAEESSRMDLIYAEVMLRETFGDRPKPDEYIFRFPDLTQSISALFQLHHALVPSPKEAETPRLNFSAMRRRS